jgi:protein-S-isoprenylcysteine O-methyltransferase Ste14
LAADQHVFGGAHWLKPLSDGLMIAGLAVRWTAILTLGKAFSSNVAIQESQTIQRSGLYRIVRHPSYLGLLIIFFAIGVHSRNWLGLAVVMVPTTAALLYRIHVEEIALRDAFGAEYADYSKSTKRLIPGIY